MPILSSAMRVLAICVLGLAVVAGEPLAAASPENTVDSGDATAAPLVPPRVTHHVVAEFPVSHRVSGGDDQELRMIVSVEVDAKGKPGRVEIVDTNLGSAYRRPALQAVSYWRFEPASRNGVPEASTILVPVTFGIRGDPVNNADIRAPGATNRVITAPRNGR